MKLVGLALVLAACGGKATVASEPIGNDGPADTVALAIVTIDRDSEQEMCHPVALAVRAVAGGRVVEEQLIEGACTGPCTEADQTAAAQHLAEVEAQVAAGASASMLDYNFTECQHFAAGVGRELDVGGVRVVLIGGDHPGPHDVPSAYYRVAVVACGRLFLGAEFGSTYTNRWNLEDLVVEARSAGLIVRAKDNPAPVDLYTLSLDCKAGFEENVLPTAW